MKITNTLNNLTETIIEGQLLPLCKTDLNAVTDFVTIIAEKEVDFHKIVKSKSVNEYNRYKSIKLTKEEFNTLKSII